mmetsp:Transcript_35254/g.56705  ORF Transcript_35254/g.56705 Transcript_35254/m.56705 type:complete len:394 (+) Transcript_35254:119-1300(+)
MAETRSRHRHEKPRRRGKAEAQAGPSSLRTRVVVCVSLVLVAGAFLISEVSLTSRAKNWRVVVQQTGAFLASQSAPAPAPTLAPTETAPPAPPAPAPAAAPVAVPDASQPTAAAVAPTAEPQAVVPTEPAQVGTPSSELKSCLSFIHIPKAGGSNVEGLIARAFGYNQVVENPGDCISMRKIEKDVRFWGMCDDRLKCETKKGCGWSNADCCYVNASFEPQPPKNTGKDRCSFWHFPPSLDPLLASAYTKDCDAFCVVRDPVTRFLSHWRWRHLGKTGCSTEALEKYTKEKLELAKDKEILLEDCHFNTQVSYAFYGGNPANERICRHIIKLENLREELPPLLKKYNLDKIKVGKSKSRASQGCDIKPTEETMRLIKEFYAEDFKAFGYPLPS